MFQRLLRRPLLSAGLLLVSIAVGLAALWITLQGEEPALAGTVLEPSPAQDFELTDQRGELVRLSDLRGKAVVLTFTFTNCPDVCPLTASSIRVAYELLPENLRDQVALLAVTVDPARDTQTALQAFSEAHGLAAVPAWHALTGDPRDLERVWAAYGVAPGTMAMDHDAATPAAGGGTGHTDAVYLIDAEGQRRVLMRSDLDPEALAANLEALLR